MKVLHVDDDERWRELLPRILSKHTVVSFASLEEARLAFVEQAPFEIVVCDGTVSVPDDGIRWAEELDRLGQNVIILSGNIPHDTISFFDKGTFDIGKFRQLFEL